MPSGFSSECSITTTDEQIKPHGHIGDLGILEIKKFFPKSAQKRFWVCVEGKKKLHQKSTQILLLVVFLTSSMNFMIIGHDLGLLEKKYFLVIFGNFWGRLSFDLKIFSRKCQSGVEIYQEPYFCMGNPKKMVSGRSVDPPDSNLGGFFWNRLLIFTLKCTLNFKKS